MSNTKVGTSKCRALCHNEALQKYPEISDELVNLFNTKKVESKICTLFKTHKFLNLKTSEKKFNVCRKCIYYVTHIETAGAEPSLNSQPVILEAPTTAAKTSSSLGLSDSNCNVKFVIDKIRKNELSTEDLQALAVSIGKHISPSVKKEAHSISSCDRKQLLSIQSYTDQWDNNTNVILKSFLEGIVNLSSKSNEEQIRRKTCLVKATQAIHSAINMKFVSPLALSENLVSYYYSGSKSVCQIFGSHAGAGSYATIQRIISDIGTTSTLFPKEDIWICFDNQQVVGKQYRWSYGSHQPISVVTSVCTFRNNKTSKLQYQPMKYCFFDPIRISSNKSKDLLKHYMQMVKKAGKVNGEYRHEYFNAMLIYVAKQCVTKNKRVDDTVLDTTAVEDNVCLQYDRVPPTKGHATICNQEVILVNPNSKKTIIQVLQTLQKNRNNQIHCENGDGLPASIIYNLLPNTYICNDCNQTLFNDRYVQDGINSFDHSCDVDVTKGHRKSFRLAFDNIFLRPGNGHYEMTFTKCILEILFELYFSAMCNMFNLKTPKAIKFVRKSYDHHRSWQFMRILINSLSSELCYEFYSYMKTTVDQSVQSFKNWAESNTNPNIFLAYVIVSSVLHPLFLFRAAIRQCASETAFLIREKLSALFFGTNHSKYRLITVYDAFLNLSIDEDFKPYTQTESVRRLGAEYGESFDFQLENENKIMKRLVNFGVPSAAEWTKISNGMDTIQQIKSETMKRLNIEMEKPLQRKVDLRKEITEFRKIIRSSKLFSASESKLICLNNECINIDPEFVNFFINCETNRDKFYADFLVGKKTKLNYIKYPGFVEKAALSYNQLCKTIRENIKTLPEPFETQYKERFFVLKSKQNIDDLYEFKLLLEEDIEDINALQHDSNESS